MKRNIDKTVTAVEVSCDMCGGDVTNTRECPARECCMCEKDICGHCTVFDERDHGDYPARFCEACWDLGRPYREEQRLVEEWAEARVVATEKGWDEACRTDWDRWHQLLDLKAARTLDESEQEEYDRVNRAVAKADAFEAAVARRTMKPVARPVLRVGDTGSMAKLVADSDISEFADATGDFNPLHLDDEYAAARFGGRVAHGAMTVGIASAVLGNDIPGPGCVVVELSMAFKAPVRPGDIVTCTATVAEIVNPKRVRLNLSCANHGGTEVASGSAFVVPPEATVLE